ncbi:hypothetical protein SAMN04487930_107159 [Cytophaga hutchinsonii ATCC 33406]|nr:hypothetical protein SAMN04487930_107159 [Cytophaga hutchinsonii ATCC 33406]
MQIDLRAFDIYIIFLENGFIKTLFRNEIIFYRIKTKKEPAGCL